jgi:hypothetical protein
MRQRACLSLGIVLVALIGIAAVALIAIPSVRVEAEASEAGAPNVGGAGVLHIAGASFVPESSSTVYSTSGEGDVAVTGASDTYMHAPVLLPDGALVSGLTLYYYDLDPGYVRASLIRNNDPEIRLGSTLASAFSPPGATGYSNDYVPTSPNPVEIDNARYNYQIEVYWSEGSSDLKLMSVKLFYTNP